MAVTSRRRFVQGIGALGMAGRAMAFAAGDGELVLVGTQTNGTGPVERSRGIYAYRLDAATGEMRKVGLAAETEMPTFLAMGPDGRSIFAVNEVDEFEGKKSGSVTGFVLERGAARLREVNRQATGGGSPCHVAVDRTGRCAFVANYVGGSAASYRVEAGGKLSEAVSFFQFSGSGPDKERQQGPHAHRVTVSPDNRFVMVNDLGLDVIHIYRLDAKTAVLTPNEPAVWRAGPGSGPRALVFHPNGRWAYCVAEMASTVYVLRWDGAKGSFETVQEVKLRPEGSTGPTGASDIVLDREGRFAYAANRLDDFLVTFTVSSEDGRLKMVERSSCGGKTPRHLSLDTTGRWLVVANQTTDNLAVFARDARTGRLAEQGKSFPLSRPQCVLFV